MLLGSSPVSGSHISCACTGHRCCSLQCLVLPLHSTRKDSWLIKRHSLCHELLGSSWLTLIPVLFVAVTLWVRQQLLSKALWAGTQGGKARSGSTAQRVLSCIMMLEIHPCWATAVHVFPSNNATEELSQHSNVIIRLEEIILVVRYGKQEIG